MDISTFIQNLSDQKKQIAISSISVIAGAILLIAYFQSGPNALSYAKAQNCFSEWESTPTDELLYQNMKEALRAVPALGKKYEAPIAQKLLDTDKIEEALIFAQSSLTRVQSEAPFHTQFAKNSLLIEQKQFQQALQNAVSLKEQMGTGYTNPYKGGSVIYAHNLLRIACLQQELKNCPGEKGAWEELEQFLQEHKPLAEMLLASFSEKQVSLTQYINERKKAL